MIYNDDAYYTGFYRNVRDLGAIPALIFDTICGLLRNSDGIGEVSNSTICELLDITPQHLRPVIKKIIQEGYIEKSEGVGRGNKCTYMITEKGKQNCPFPIVDKRETFFPKKGNKISIKGKQNCPLNKELNKELKGGSAHEHTPAPAPTPTTPPQKDFLEFWNLFCPDTSHDADKQNCFAVWQSMSEDSQKTLLNDLRAGRRYKKTDNPYWYLKDWQAPLPFMRQGTQAFADWLDRARKDGKGVLLIKYPVDPNVPVDQAPLAYCLAEDKDKMLNAGAVLLGIFANK